MKKAYLFLTLPFFLLLGIIGPLGAVNKTDNTKTLHESREGHEIETLSVMQAVRSLPLSSEMITKTTYPTLRLRSGKTAYGYCIFDKAWAADEAEFGLYSFNTASPAMEQKVWSGTLPVDAGTYYEGYYYVQTSTNNGAAYTSMEFGKFNATTGEYTRIADWWVQTIDPRFTDMTIDYSTDPPSLLGIARITPTMRKLAKIDMKTGELTMLSNGYNTPQVLALACKHDGTLYAITTAGKLVTINKTTGASQPVGTGTTGVTPQFLQSMEFDHTDGTLYWACVNSTGVCKFGTIDLTTALFTAIGTEDNAEFTALHIPFAPAGSPEGITNLVLTPGANGALSANLSWTNPSRDNTGENLSSITSVKIYRNNELINNFENPALGSTANFMDNVTVAGIYTYKISVENSAGVGESAFIEAFIGEDVPSAPTDIVLIKDATNNGVLTWVAPVKSINGGWFNVDNIRYKITRLPDNKVISEDVTGLTYTDNTIEQYGVYSYTVQAKTTARDGGIGTSNTLKLGTSVNIPYVYNFDDADKFNIWTVIDNNQDNKTWTLDTNVKAAKYWYSSKNKGDDWLISPPIALQKGKTYRVSFAAKCNTVKNAESLKVFWGKGASPEAQTNQIIDLPSITINEFMNHSAIFTIPETEASVDNYNIGFYAYSEKNKHYLFVTNFVIEELFENDIAAQSIVGQTLPMVDKECSYTITVNNKGSKDQNAYTVQLVSESTILDTVEIKETLKADSTNTVVLKWTPLETGILDIKGKVILTTDEYLANNETAPLSVDVQLPGDQEWVVIGSGTGFHSAMPIDFFAKTSATQSIYLAQEVEFKGMIKKITYKYNNNSPVKGNITNKPIKVYMASTKNANLSNGWIPEDQMTLVFDGVVNLVQGINDLTITLSTPFIYAEGNLCVMVVRPLDTQYYGVGFMYTSTGSEVRTLTYDDSKTEFDYTQTGTPETKIPNIKILAVTAGAGKIQGTVKNNNTLPLADVKMTILPLEISTNTDETGVYSFGFVPAGTYSLKATKHGYEVKVEADVISVADQTTTRDISMSKLATYTVTGQVKDLDGKVITAADVVVEGYEEYKATTNADGAFTIQRVYKADNYSIQVVKKGYVSYLGVFNVVDANVTLPEIVMSDVTNRPTDVLATMSTSKVDLTWGEPLDETIFRYDDGVVNSYVGLQSGTVNGIMGSVHKTAANLVNMSWWTVGVESAGGPHAKVNIFVMDLDADGKPTSNVLFSKMDVPNVDDKWNTFCFESKVECPHGFMIAISYTGFAGIGCDSGTNAEWPFIVDGNYYTGDYTTGKYTLLTATDKKAHNFLIRAQGYKMNEDNNATPLTKKDVVNNAVNLNAIADDATISKVSCIPYVTPELNEPSESKAMNGYKVWRLLEADQADESKWTLLTTSSITAMAYTDNSWTSVPVGAYKYAVKAVYSADACSAAAFSNLVARDMITAVTVNVKTNTTTNESTGATVILTNNDNNPEHVYTATVADGKVVINDVWKGIYRVNVKHAGFTPTEKTNIDLTATTQSIDVILNEITIKPYNVEITKIDKESERILSWNVSKSIEDDFERHANFTVNSTGSCGWNYIDADGLATQGIQGCTFSNSADKMAYIIFNPTETTPPIDNESIKPHSESKFMAAFAVNPPTNKDYFISPKLSFPMDFTFSFWAKTYSDKYGLERIKVGYSTTGKAEKDFTNWLTKGNYEEVPAVKWTKYSYTVPASAKYVTIECVSSDAFIFMIDDVSIGIEPSKAFVNYEVYLDGDKVDVTSEKTYQFVDLTNGDHIAGVKAIYTSGVTEMATVPFNVDIVGIDDVNALSLNIYPNPVQNILHVEGDYTMLEIYNVSGKLMMTIKGQQQIDLNALSKGAYTIKAYNNDKTSTYKIIK